MFAGIVIMIIACLLSAGAKEFAIVNKLFTGINIAVIIFVIIMGMTQIDFHNWNLSESEVYDLAYNATQVDFSNSQNCRGKTNESTGLRPTIFSKFHRDVIQWMKAISNTRVFAQKCCLLPS